MRMRCGFCIFFYNQSRPKEFRVTFSMSGRQPAPPWQAIAIANPTQGLAAASAQTRKPPLIPIPAAPAARRHLSGGRRAEVDAHRDGRADASTHTRSPAGPAHDGGTTDEGIEARDLLARRDERGREALVLV